MDLDTLARLCQVVRIRNYLVFYGAVIVAPGNIIAVMSPDVRTECYYCRRDTQYRMVWGSRREGIRAIEACCNLCTEIGRQLPLDITEAAWRAAVREAVIERYLEGMVFTPEEREEVARNLDQRLARSKVIREATLGKIIAEARESLPADPPDLPPTRRTARAARRAAAAASAIPVGAMDAPGDTDLDDLLREMADLIDSLDSGEVT